MPLITATDPWYAAANLFVTGMDEAAAMPMNPRRPETLRVLSICSRQFAIGPSGMYDSLLGKDSVNVQEKNLGGDPARSATLYDVGTAVSNVIVEAAKKIPQFQAPPADSELPDTLQVHPIPAAEIR